MKKSKLTSVVLIALLGLSVVHAETKIADTPLEKALQNTYSYLLETE